MNDSQKLLEKVKSKNIQWEDLAEFLDLNDEELEPFFNHARKITSNNFKNVLKIYIPNERFPAISVTGTECALECEHCDKKYLNAMIPISNSAELEKFLLELSKKKGTGILLSGGCESNGSVPLLNFLDTIKKVKAKTNLIINAHTGFLNEETGKKLAEAKVDIVSFDVNMDDEVIRNIYHLDKDLIEYKRTLDLLKKNNLNVVPHICVGLYYGKLHSELESIKFIKESEINPSLIVIIALIPPKGSNLKFETPKPIDIAKVIAAIRFVFPKTEISLGCMRPRGPVKIEIEKYAIKAGITRIEIPSKETLKWVKIFDPRIRFKFFSTCCAIPAKYEKFSKSSYLEYKRYLNF